MMFVDTNVLLDIVTDDPTWVEWSTARLAEALIAGPIAINDVVYAEMSVRYPRLEDLEATLSAIRVTVAPIPRAALFLTGKAFQQYRRAGGTRTGVLPDFFIGAHAAVEGWPLLTRDGRRYRGYFPTLNLVAPA